MLGINPDVTLVDSRTTCRPHDIPFAAQELAATYKYFPAGTIFLVVVDPGVGTRAAAWPSRRATGGSWRPTTAC